MCQQQAKSSASQATEEAGGGDRGGLLFVPRAHRKKARVPADHRMACVEHYSIAVCLRWCHFCAFHPHCSGRARGITCLDTLVSLQNPARPPQKEDTVKALPATPSRNCRGNAEQQGTGGELDVHQHAGGAPVSGEEGPWRFSASWGKR